MSKQLYVYSGIQPGKKGAGNFVSFFLEQLNTNKVNFNLVAYNTPDGFFVKLTKKMGLHSVLKKTYYKVVQFVSKPALKNEDVLIFHPQSIGLDICIDLINNNNVFIYVLDNFLFCKKSYNFVKGYKPCIKCINNRKAHLDENCSFFPVIQEQDKYDLFLETIEKNVDRIAFLTQNPNQGLLLKERYGSNVSIRHLGMMIAMEKRAGREKGEEAIHVYDFLYHNTLSEAKGLKFFLETAKILKDYSFVVPYSKSEVRRVAPFYDDLKNVQFISLTWESGLAHILENCKIAVNPSLWSSPVEGALLKSIHHNGCVAVVSSEYSFPAELPEDAFIKLSAMPEEAAQKLKQVIETKGVTNSYKLKSKEWLRKYKQSVKSNINEFINRELNLL